MENVITPPKLACALQRHDVQRFFDDTDAMVTAGIETHATRIALRGVETNGAETNPFLDVKDRFGERNRVLTRCSQEVISQS
jgi:hypothetical protein